MVIGPISQPGTDVGLGLPSTQAGTRRLLIVVSQRGLQRYLIEPSREGEKASVSVYDAKCGA